jgi:hypothetical protein
MKYEWKKNEKSFYLPKSKPELITIPKFKFFTIKGKGNPNDSFFAEYIAVLYSLSYAVRMSHKQGMAPKDYFEYTVYPLEGVWYFGEIAKDTIDGKFDKNQLIFNLMVRQPDFVTDDFATKIIEITKKKKPHELLDKVLFESIADGESVQMLHTGNYDSETESFKQMNIFTAQMKKTRTAHTHREIYLSDPRKVVPEKLKTVLRFQVKDI